VKARLFDDNIVEGASISFDTFEGNVTLTGAVENERQRESTTAIVKSLYGVRKTRNLPMIKKKLSHGLRNESKKRGLNK
jgi:hyperosmotically inducible protein